MDKGRISIEIDYENEAIRLAAEKVLLKEECESKEMRIRELEAELRGIKSTIEVIFKTAYAEMCLYMKPDDFCSYGERKDNDR